MARVVRPWAEQAEQARTAATLKTLSAVCVCVLGAGFDFELDPVRWLKRPPAAAQHRIRSGAHAAR